MLATLNINLFFVRTCCLFRVESKLNFDHQGKLLSGNIKDDTGRIQCILVKNLLSRHEVHLAQGTLTLQEQVLKNSCYENFKNIVKNFQY